MTPSRIAKGVLALSVLLACVVGDPVVALTDEEIFREFRFNFINPGARSLGLAGAFIAAADDTTAAEANPAALHFVNRFEFFAEYRSLQSDPRRFRSGSEVNVAATPVNLPFVDLTTETNIEDNQIPSFLSFAYPFNLGGTRATLAVSRQVMLDATNSLGGESDQQVKLNFAFEDFPEWNNPEGQTEQYAVSNQSFGQLDAELVNLNLAFSLSFGDDFSLGLTGTQSSLDMTSFVQNQAQDPRGVLETVNPRVDADNDDLFEDVITQSRINDTDSDFTYTLGLHYHPGPFKFGVVYRQGAELVVPQFIDDVNPDTMVTTELESFQTTLRVPDRYGIGLAGDLGNKKHWTIALDLERIEYSDLLQDFRTGVNFFTSGQIPLDITGDPDFRFDVNDATVVHFGLEYLRPARTAVIGFRGGFFTAPDNRIRMSSIDTGSPPVNDAYLDAFRGGEDENHITFGATIGYQSISRTQQFRLDFAGDLSDTDEQFLVSVIYRWGELKRGS